MHRNTGDASGLVAADELRMPTKCGHRRPKRRWLRSSVLVAAIASCSILLAACSSSGGGSSSSDGASAQALTNVEMTESSSSAGYWLNYLALGAGIFKKNGLNVQLIVSSSGAQATTTLLSGDVQFAASDAASPFAAEAQGKSLIFLARPYSGFAADLILSKTAVAKIEAEDHVTPTSSVTARIRALDGLTIAGSNPSSGFTQAVVKITKGVGATVKWAYMAQTVQGEELGRNQIDGMVAAPPYSTEAVLQDDGVQWLTGLRGEFPGFGSDYLGSSYVTTKSYVASHQAVVVAMLRSILQAAELVKSSPTTAEAAIKKTIPSGLSNTVFDAVWQEFSASYTSPLVTLAQLQGALADFPPPSGGAVNVSDMLDPTLVQEAQK
jgi:ABC-type nitrate/sulfonate/bicarbonate transport system substrate-binding protein